jgi:hypothetical protein
MKATVLQKKDGSFTVSILNVVANQFRAELRGEGITAGETVSTEGGQEAVAFSFNQKIYVEDIEKLLELVGYDFTTKPVD